MTDSTSFDPQGGFSAAFLFLRRTSAADATLWLLCGLAVLASFTLPNHYPPWVAAQQDIAAGAAALLLLVALVHRSQPIAWPPAALFFASLAVLPMLQATFGLTYFFGDAWIASLYLACAAVAVACGHAAHRKGRTAFAVTLGACLLAAGLVSCVLALAQRFQVDWGPMALFLIDVRPGHAPFANLAQPNHLGTLLVLSLAALAYLYERHHVRASWAAGAALLVVVCTALTQSRAALPLLLALGAWRVLFGRRSGLRIPRLFMAALVVAWVTSYALWPVLSQWASVGDMPTLASRLEPGPRTILWRQLFDAALRRPWAGYGWNQVSVAQMEVAADYGRTRFTEHSHNLPLDLMLWCGIPLAAVILAAALRWAFVRGRTVASLEGGFAFSIVLVLAVHSLVEFPLDYLYFLVPFGWAVGIVEKECGAAARLALPAYGRAALTALTAALLLVATFDYLRFEDAFRDLRFSVARIGRPIVFDHGGPPPTEFTQLAAYFRLALAEPRERMSAAEVESMRRASTRFPYVPALYRFAVSQALNDDVEGARLTFRRLRVLHGEEHFQAARRDAATLASTRYPVLRQLELQ